MISSSLTNEIIRRRYSDFEILRNSLTQRFGGILIPLLPEKKALTTSLPFLLTRARGLSHFLHVICKNPYFVSDSMLIAFMTNNMNWDALRKAATDSGLGEVAASSPFKSFFAGKSNTVVVTPQQTGATSPSPVVSPSLAQASEERWKGAVSMYVIPSENVDADVKKIKIFLNELDEILKVMHVGAMKNVQAAKQYATNVMELQANFEKTCVNNASLKKLNLALVSWADTCELDSILVEELLLEELKSEQEVVKEMKVMLEAREVLFQNSDYCLRVLHKFEVEKEGFEKSGMTDRVIKSNQRIQEALKQCKLADYKVEFYTKALFLGCGLKTFVDSRIENLSTIFSKFSLGKMKHGQLITSAWMASIALLKGDLSDVEKQSKVVMTNLEMKLPLKFKGVLGVVVVNNVSSENKSNVVSL